MKTNFVDRIQLLAYEYGLELACALEGITVQRYYEVLWQGRHRPYFQNVFSQTRNRLRYTTIVAKPQFPVMVFSFRLTPYTAVER
jgi:hypothetical protein